MTIKPKGGRGKIAPYETVTVRIPLPIKGDVEKMANDYRESALQPVIHEIKKMESKKSDFMPLNEAISHAQSIMKGKKSARVSLEKMLQVLYGEQISL